MIGCKSQYGSFFSIKVDVTFQCDGSCVECTFGTYNRATAIQSTCNDSLVDCLIEGSIRGVGFGAEVHKEICMFWDRCFLDLVFNLCSIFESLIEIYRVGCCQCGREQKGNNSDYFFQAFPFLLLMVIRSVGKSPDSDSIRGKSF